MIGSDECGYIATELIDRVVCEPWQWLRQCHAQSPQSLQVIVECDLPQHDYDARILETLQLLIEVNAAIRNLLGQRFVVRRRAVADRRDVGADQPQPVIAALPVRPVGKFSLVERAEQPPPGRVARKHTPCPIRPVRAGGQANNQQPRTRIAQTRQGFRPIIPVAELALLLTTNSLPVRNEARTKLAANDPLIQLVVPVHAASDLVRDPFIAKLLDALL